MHQHSVNIAMQEAHIHHKLKRLHKSGITRGVKYILYFSTTVLSLSGILWLFTHYILRANCISHKIIVVHGICGYFFIFTFGLIWDGHIKKWFYAKRRSNFKSGVINVGLIFILALTGLILYYSGSDDVRNIASILHWVIGCFFVIVFVIHIIVFKIISAKKKKKFFKEYLQDLTIKNN